jgi:hypothetical protein
MPTFAKKKEAFNCPYCGAYAHQDRGNCCSDIYVMTNFSATKCCNCEKYAIWLKQNTMNRNTTEEHWQLIYPAVGDAPRPNPDLPDDIKKDYLEARAILAKSPRGASALLRLAIDKLCDYLGAKGEKLNNKIGSLVGNGLPKNLQKAFDIVRITGNHAIHPGQIDVDNIESAKALFELVNIITNHMISENKQIDGIYDMLPGHSKKGIEKRDSNQQKRK